MKVTFPFPHAIIITEHSRPTSIWMAAIFGMKRLKYVALDASSTDSLIDQAVNAAKDRPRLFRDDNDVIPAFGYPIGVVVNYAEDHSVKYDLDGIELERFDRIIEIGFAEIEISPPP